MSPPYTRGRNVAIVLANGAAKTSVAAAEDIWRTWRSHKLPGITGTNAIHIIGQTLTSTGVSKDFAKQCGVEVNTSCFEDNERPDFMNDANKSRVRLKIVSRKKDNVIVGAQVASLGEHDRSEVIYFLSLAVAQKLTIYQVALADFFFLPHLNKPFDFIIKAALGDPARLHGSSTHPLGESIQLPKAANGKQLPRQDKRTRRLETTKELR